MVSIRSPIVVLKHRCHPKLLEPVHMGLWHLVLREQKFCSLKFNMRHKWIPVILLHISRSGQGSWREIISITVRWCSYAFEITSNAMRVVLPSRTGWYSLVHCEGSWPIDGGRSSWTTACCIGGPLELRLEWTQWICCIKPEWFFNLRGQKGHEKSWDWEDMTRQLRKNGLTLCTRPLFLFNQQRSTLQCLQVALELCYLPPHHMVKSTYFVTFLWHFPFFFFSFSMVETQERNKDTHPGQPLVPKACKSKEQAAAECAEKAIAS